MTHSFRFWVITGALASAGFFAPQLLKHPPAAQAKTAPAAFGQGTDPLPAKEEEQVRPEAVPAAPASSPQRLLRPAPSPSPAPVPAGMQEEPHDAAIFNEEEPDGSIQIADEPQPEGQAIAQGAGLPIAIATPSSVPSGPATPPETEPTAIASLPSSPGLSAPSSEPQASAAAVPKEPVTAVVKPPAAMPSEPIAIAQPTAKSPLSDLKPLAP